MQIPLAVREASMEMMGMPNQSRPGGANLATPVNRVILIRIWAARST